MEENLNEWSISDERKGSDNKRFLAFLSRLYSNWYWFALSGIVGLLFGYLYVRYTAPVFNITAKVLVNDEKKGGPLSGQSELLDLGGLLGGKSSVDNEAEILKTRFLMEQVVKDLNANVEYFFKGRIRSVQIHESPFFVRLLNVKDSIPRSEFVLESQNDGTLTITDRAVVKRVRYNRPFLLDGIGKIELIRNPAVAFGGDGYSFILSSIDEKVDNFMRLLSVGVTNKQVSTIDLSFKHHIPRMGEEILETLIKRYVQGNLEDKNVIADSTISFIEDRLMYVGQELGDIEGNIQRFKQNSRLTNIGEQSKLLLQSSSSQIDQLAKLETQISVLEALKNFLDNGTKDNRVLPSAVLEGDIVFSALIEKYNALLLERDRQTLSSTDTNPFVENLDKQIQNLKTDIMSNLNSTLNAIRISASDLRSRGGSLNSEIRQVPATERKYLDLARQQQIKQELYIFLLQKREETAISKTSNISNSKVIDPPKADPNPISPRRRLIYLLGLLAGLTIPFAILYLRSTLSVRVENKDDIARELDIPIIGEIGSNKEEGVIVVTKDSRSPIVEQFRGLRTNLSFFLKDSEKTILLTSSMSGEGKSFIALNLALILAISGKKVVVMELDLRKPNLANKINKVGGLGFTSFIISSELSYNEVVQPSGVNENLFIVSSGPIPPNPAEMILDSRTDELMASLKREFDYIIIDAPPVGLVTDAQLLSKFSDLTLYIVRQGYTFRDQLEIANDLFSKKKMKNLSIVVNDIKVNSGYGYGYGYGYHYGSYGDDNAPSAKRISRLFRK